MSQPKVTQVRVHRPHASALLPEPNGLPPVSVCGDYFGNTRQWNRRVSESVDINYVSVKEAVEKLTKAAKYLADAEIEVDVDNYGTAEVYVKGYRPTTDEEARWVRWALDQEKQRAEAAEAAEVERLKAKRPDLFK